VPLEEIAFIENYEPAGSSPAWAETLLAAKPSRLLKNAETVR
jgi:hypothetical protein